MVSLGSIIGGMTGGASVSIVIKSVDEFSKGFKDAQKGIQNTGNAAQGTSKDFIAWGATATAVAAVMVDLTKRGLEFNEVASNFNYIVGEQSTKVLDSMRSSTRGLVSDIDLMGIAMKGTSLGLLDNESEIKNYSTLMGIAAIQAKTMGISTEEAANAMTKGIAKGNERMLSSIGIIVDLDAAYKRYADSIGVAVTALTIQQKQTVATTEVIKSMREELLLSTLQEESSKDKVDRLYVSTVNLANAIGSYIITGAEGVIELDKIHQAADAAGVSFEEMAGFVYESRREMDEAGKKSKEFSDYLHQLEEDAKSLEDSLNTVVNSIKGIGNIKLEGEYSMDKEYAEAKLDLAEAKVGGDEDEIAKAQERLDKIREELDVYQARKDVVAAQGQIELADRGLIAGEVLNENTYLGELLTSLGNIETQQQINKDTQELITKYAAEQTASTDDTMTYIKSIAENYGPETAKIMKEDLLPQVWKWETAISNVESSVWSIVDGLKEAAELRAESSNSISVGGATLSFDDMIWRPGESPVAVNPNDTIIASKNGGFGSQQIEIYIDASNLSADEVATALSNKFQTLAHYGSA